MKNKRLLCGLLALTAALSLTACSGSSAASGTQSADASASTGGDASGEDGYTTVTVFCPNTSTMPMTNDTSVIKVLSEKAKTNFDFVNSPTTGTEEKFNLMMASGDIPDLVIYTQDPILEYTQAFAPLNDLIEEYCPNYANLLDEYPFLRKDTTAADGNIYTIQSKGPFKFANAFLVRQDWLDKLGLETPTTLEEFYDVLKAFKEQDPNGNGEADEIPLVVSDARRTDAESPGLSIFDASFGIDEDFYVSDDGSEILFGATDPRMKDALSYLNTLYTDGLIDQEYLTRDYASYDGLITSNRAGMWIAWGVGVEDVGTIQDPDAELSIILPPVSEDGELRIYTQMPQTRTNALAISKDSQVKEHIMEIWNYIFSEEGTILMNYGVEGETYELVDGDPEYLDEILNSEEGVLNTLRKSGVNSWLPLNQLADAEFDRSSEKFAAAVEEYEPYIVSPVPPLKFTDEEKSTITSVYNGEIETYMDESLDSFITGKTSLDQFDSFVEQMNKMGLQDILQIYNDAYARYQATE